jgi:Putative transposase
VGCRYGKAARETEMMDYLEFIGRVVSRIPYRGQVMVRYYGLYANAHQARSTRRASRLSLSALKLVEEGQGNN